jgi:hypothetical protein
MWFGHQETATQRFMRHAKENAADMVDRVSDVELDETQAARTLGWASMAIAATEIAAPHVVEKLLGLPHDAARQGSIRALGVREFGHGLSILAADRRDGDLAGALWGRVAGDVLDTVCLGKAMPQSRSPGQFLAVSAMVAAIGVADLWCAARLSANA